MIRAFILALSIVACSCSTAPIAPDAQAQISAIKDRYVAALKAAHGLCTPACYNASAAIVTADTERTQASIDKARRATDEMVNQ